MGLNTTPESSGGILNAIKGSLGLFNDLNKAQGVTENTNPTPIDPYESTLDPIEVMELVAQWKRTYSVYYADIKKGQELSFDYWVGKHRDPYSTSINTTGSGKDIGVTDNLIFEAIETFLPIATRANPDPLVQADPSDEGQQMAADIKAALVHEADVQQLRRKLAKMTRGWLLNRLGVLKVSWNPLTKSIETDVVNAKRMVFDKDGYINEKACFVGEYLGEKKRASAKQLIQMFPKKREYLTKQAHGKLGTMLEYFEWWYRGADVFYTQEDMLLGKFKNPNWNYNTPAKDGKEAIIDTETGNEVSPAEEAVGEIEASNHLLEPSAPYRFLSIFSTNEQPHDNTSLILQNIPQQDKINRREQQIDRNVEGMNNGMIVDGKAFTEDQAANAASALRRGVAIRVPNGDVGKAVMFPQKPALPGDVFKSLEDGRAELRNIFGTAGSSAQAMQGQETVRGKIMVNQMDSSRIGGGITDCIEQVADAIYNLWVQFMFVYYDEPHFISAAGTVDGMELISLTNAKFPLLKTLTITVKEGSLVPKDPLTQRNEAIELWSANAIDPLSLYKKLDFPNATEATNQLILWQMLQKGAVPPQAYLPTFAMAGQTPGQTPPMVLPTEQPGTGGPAVSPPPQNGVVNPPVGTSVEQKSKELLRSEPIPKA